MADSKYISPGSEEQIQSEKKSPYKEVLSNFLDSTSSHGLPRIGSERSTGRKIFWGVVFLAALAYFLYQLSGLINTYLQYPVTVNTKIENRGVVDFPAVTVCNMNMLRKSFAKDNEKYKELSTIEDKYLGIEETDDGDEAEELEDDAKKKRRRRSEQKKRIKREYEYDEEYDEENDEQYYDEENEDYDEENEDYDYYSYDEEYAYLYESDYFDVKDDFDFDGILKESKTSDLSDLVDVLRPTPEDLQKMGEVKKDFIVTCSFDKRNCSDSDFQTTHNSYYGNCFTFNSGMNGKVNRTSKYGSRYGLRLILNLHSFDYIGFFTPDQGVRVSVHPQNITPFPQDEGISAGPGRKTSIGAKLQMVVRQEHPYESNCTTGEGRKISYEGDYTSLACSLTCLEDKIFDRCGCRERLTKGSNDSFCSFTNKTEAKCRAGVFAAYSKDALGCDCPMACLAKTYLTSVSSSKWPTISFISMLRDLRQITAIDDMPDEDGMVSLATIEENLVHLQVYIEDKSLITIEEIPSYEWARLVADMGGLLGLFVGISVCTGIEFIELGVDLILVATKRKPENRPAVHSNISRSEDETSGC